MSSQAFRRKVIKYVKRSKKMSKDSRDNQKNQSSHFNHSKHDIEAKVSFHYSDKSIDNHTDKNHFDWLRARQADYAQQRAAYFDRLKKELEIKDARRKREQKEKEEQRQRYLEEKKKVVPLHKKAKTKEPAEKGTKFQGRLSKASEVPSPVRGYLNNREKQTPDISSEECQAAQLEKASVEVEQVIGQKATVIPFIKKEEPSQAERENVLQELQQEEGDTLTNRSRDVLLNTKVLVDEYVHVPAHTQLQENDQDFDQDQSNYHTDARDLIETENRIAAGNQAQAKDQTQSHTQTQLQTQLHTQTQSETQSQTQSTQTQPQHPSHYQSQSQSQDQSNAAVSKREQPYIFPSYTLLQQASGEISAADTEWVEHQAETLLSTFAHFSLNAELIHVTQGPAVTRFEIQPAPGIKINRFTNLIDDLKLALAAKEIRIEAPIPGKHAIGIEIPNKQAKPVFLKEIISSPVFKESDSPLVVALGSAIDGEPICTDLQKMPHGLIAGSTGSGKSVCINSILVSLLYKARPDALRLILIDPKMVELTPYSRIPHLLTPVVTDPKRATAALKWTVQEMERRYQLFADCGVRDLSRYNKVMQEQTGEVYTLPYIVVIIDELADLMMVAPGDVEEAICRLTQKARACGIHLLLATQRPSVDVITGLIKSNIPSRIAFAVSSAVDSRTILDSAGAERLLGKGDMLFIANGAPKPIRIQGTFVSDEEIEAVVEHVSKQDEQNFLITSEDLKQDSSSNEESEDELIEEVAFFVMEQGTASTSSIQRRFRIGYNRAARMIDWLEAQGMITSAQGSKPRDVLWSQEYFLEWIDSR